MIKFKRRNIVVLVVLCLSHYVCCTRSNGKSHLDTTLTIDERVEILIEKMTLQEKVMQLCARNMRKSAEVEEGFSDVIKDGIEMGNTFIENCFLVSCDDNMKLRENSKAKHVVVWQMHNAHPIMVQASTSGDFGNAHLEDIDVISYQDTPAEGANPWPYHSDATIACARAGNSLVSNYVYKDIRVEFPFLIRPISIYNINTANINAPWFKPTNENHHTRITDFLFENITINAPVIFLKSLVGSCYENSLDNITFKNLVINGIKVTEENKNDYFEFKNAKTFDLNNWMSDAKCSYLSTIRHMSSVSIKKLTNMLSMFVCFLHFRF
ncbi:MAG: hypothetical protein KAS71_07970 [Bacteroidales bacterium]|nr:hypothetical protein [Bacteroidales bacterium]